MVRLDRHGRSVTWNAAAAHVLAPVVALAPGVRLVDAFDDPSSVEELLARSLAGEQVTGVSVALHGEGGPPRRVRLTLVPLVEGSQRAVGVTALLRDVTEEARLHQALEVKDEMLSTAAHELRSPLTSIAGFASLAAKAAPEHAELLEPIERNARDMQRLVETLLEQTRLDSGRVTVHPTRFLLAPAVQQLLTDIAEEIGSTPVLIEIPDGTTIDMDAQAFTLVLRNLVTNAAKYGADGTVEISAETMLDAVIVSVADEGPGIPAEHQARLFEPFFRVPGTMRKVRGSGLGLSIVRRYVELHGGEVRCVSAPGDGTTFSFTVPTVEG